MAVCPGVPIRQQGRVSESKVVDRTLPQYFSSFLLHPPGRATVRDVAVSVVGLPLQIFCSVCTTIPCTGTCTSVTVHRQNNKVYYQASDDIHHTPNPIQRLVSSRHPTAIKTDSQIDDVVFLDGRIQSASGDSLLLLHQG